MTEYVRKENQKRLALDNALTAKFTCADLMSFKKTNARNVKNLHVVNTPLHLEGVWRDVARTAAAR